MTPRQHEQNANNALGIILQGMMTTFDVRYENTRIIEGHPGMHPDILITADGRSPVVVEAEYDPAGTAEAEARERLGLRVNNRPIEAVIALRYPPEVADAYDLAAAVAAAPLSYCLFTVAKYGPAPHREIHRVARFPETGWLNGAPSDLADLIRLVSVPHLAVEQATDALITGIDGVAAILDEVPGCTPAIARLLGMDDVPQTRRMAGAIIANAMVFHERIARIYPAIRPLHLVCGNGVANPLRETVNAWQQILEVNYWSIFSIGKNILQQLTSMDAKRVLNLLELIVGNITNTGIDNTHDLTGRVFQRLISDRKYLATFYTLPPSADLLARLAVAKLNNIDLSDADAIARLRVADLACGTGALLSGFYEQITARYEQSGGNPANIHHVMIEEVLYGCDVMPSAIHITGSTLSGMQPSIGFDNSRLYTMPYGRLDDGSVKIGSLELLQSSSVMTLFNTSDPAQRTGSIGEETAAQVNVDVPDLAYDAVIMNPPFTSNTKHYDADEGVQNAAFAAFNASRIDQNKMAAQMQIMAADTCYHGHAGLASAFAALAHRKVKTGGVVAFVLPFTAINGASWAKFREMIAGHYQDITIVSISANSRNMSFSSDTGIAECLLIARKIAEDETPDSRAVFVSLSRRPPGLLEAAETAKAIIAATVTRHLEDGPYGGDPVTIGESTIGEMLNAPLDDHANGWGAARIADYSVAQTAYYLAAGQLWLPAEPQSIAIPIAQLNQVGQRGHDSQLFISAAHKGPFILNKRKPSRTVTYPALWNHSAKNETRMICQPDSQLRVRRGRETRAHELWATASRVHLNRDFTFGSQALAVAFTERGSIGGRVWPNVIFDDKRRDYAFSLWGNSTLGLLSYWWHSSRQQSSKAGMTIRQSETLPTLDLRALTDDQLAAAETIFNEFRQLVLEPAYLADADPNRALLDRRVIRDLLGLDHATYRAVRRLAAKWCAEPSVHGGKPRPETAEYAE